MDVRSIVASSRACMSTRLQSIYVRREQPQTFVRTYALYVYKSWYTTVDNLTSTYDHSCGDTVLTVTSIRGLPAPALVRGCLVGEKV
jgi:hypothetical protein